jgi:hypothetical protein
VRAPVEQFATWHHLRRLRRNSAPGQANDGPKRSAQQEVTETIKFLTWLEAAHHRTAATCRQQDVDEYLASGPTTRHLIRTFFVWAKKSKINTAVLVAHRQAKTTRVLTQEQRLAWLKELLTGEAESLPYRVAGTLLLLYAQPLTRIVALKTTAIVPSPPEMRISLGVEPVPVPSPLAGMLSHHLRNRPNLRTGGGMVANPWLFPGYRPGTHLDPQSIMLRLRKLGVNLLGGATLRCRTWSPKYRLPWSPNCSAIATKSPNATPNLPPNHGRDTQRIDCDVPLRSRPADALLCARRGVRC